ncbi:Peroxidase 5 [Bienertia sinuspersici]
MLTSFLYMFFLSMACMSTAAASLSLKIGFYNQSCPSAEEIVKNVVDKAIIRNPGLGAGLIRMHFHDCFVRGCDASVLVDSTPGSRTEKEHLINNPSLRGYEVIDEAKAEVEAQCPQTVSRADILAFAARDSACLLGGIKYAVQSGRRDGLYPSNISNPRDLPMDPKFSRMLILLVLDNSYYQNVVNRRVLFTSDQMLMASPETATMVKIFRREGELWAKNFAKAMVHMGSIKVLTGFHGEIRKSFGAVNRN